MGEEFGEQENDMREGDEVLEKLLQTFKILLSAEVDAKQLAAVIKNNNIRETAQLTDILISKMFDEYNNKNTETPDFIGPMKPGTSTSGTDHMEIMPYDETHPNVVSKTEEDDYNTAVNNSILDSVAAASTSGNENSEKKKNEEEKIRDVNKTTGLNNQGNTCWFNALTQMLFSIPKFRSILYHAPPVTWQQTPITNVQPEFVVHAELLIQFRRLFAEMHFSEESYIHVGDLLTTVDRLYVAKGNRSTINLQQDASEMLTLIVEWLGSAINAAIYAHLHPECSTVTVEDANMVVSQSTELPPNSDVAGTAPPGYEEKVQVAGMPSTSSVKREPGSRTNSPVRNGPPRDAYGKPKAKSPRQSPPDLLESIDEAMDTSEGPADVLPPPPPPPSTFVAPKAEVPEVPEVLEEAKTEAEVAPEVMNDLVESLKNDTAAIFESKLFIEKYAEDGSVEGEANTSVHCPVCFTLPVCYGNFHDGLESYTFGNRLENGTDVNTRSMYNNLPAVFFVSLLRFDYGDAFGGRKLHDRFTFPREVFMDRYLRKNADLVMPLRRRLTALRLQMAQLRASLAGMKRYPVPNSADTMDLVEAVRTVLNATTNSSHSGLEDTTSFDKPPNFVKSFFKQVPFFTEGQIPGLNEMNAGLLSTLQVLEQQEAHLNYEIERLKYEIDTVYDVEGLKNEMYELKAMIIHSGEINRGHYWTYKLKRSIDGLEEWEKLNDSNTEVVDYSRIEQEAFGTGYPGSPTAYLLLYVKKDATWLMSADNETRAESLANLPTDLQAHVEQTSTEWRQRLLDYREGRTGTILKPEPVYATTQTYEQVECPLKFAWYRSLSDMQADENANPDQKSCLANPLDSYEVPTSDASEMINMDSLIQHLWTLALNFDRDSFSSQSDLLDWHLRGTIEGERGGKRYIERQLDFKVKDLRSDAENDIEFVYNAFIQNYITEMSKRETDWRSRFVVYVATQLPRVYAPVIRYLLVRSMAVSNLGVLKHRAQAELNGYQLNSSDKGQSMEKIAETLVHIFHLSLITASNVRLSLENVRTFLENESSIMASYKEKEHVEKLFTAMVCARNARYTHQYLMKRAGFLEQPNIHIATQVQLDTCTILATLGALKMVLKVIVTTYHDFNNFVVSLSGSEHTLSVETFVNEICIVLSLIRQWKNGYNRTNKDEITELQKLYDALSNKMELMMTFENLSTEKARFAQQLYGALTDAQTVWPDDVARDMRFPVQPASGAEELENLAKNMRQLDPIKSKVDALLTSFDEIITKLWS